MWDIDGIRSHSLVSDHLENVTVEYLSKIHKNINEEDFVNIKEAKSEFVYSAMHGVGFPYIERAFEHFNFKVWFNTNEVFIIKAILIILF